jgi:hypothetical protein
MTLAVLNNISYSPFSRVSPTEQYAPIKPKNQQKIFQTFRAAYHLRHFNMGKFIVNRPNFSTDNSISAVMAFSFNLSDLRVPGIGTIYGFLEIIHS